MCIGGLAPSWEEVEGSCAVASCYSPSMPTTRLTKVLKGVNLPLKEEVIVYKLEHATKHTDF